MVKNCSNPIKESRYAEYLALWWDSHNILLIFSHNYNNCILLQYLYFYKLFFNNYILLQYGFYELFRNNCMIVIFSLVSNSIIVISYNKTISCNPLYKMISMSCDNLSMKISIVFLQHLEIDHLELINCRFNFLDKSIYPFYFLYFCLIFNDAISYVLITWYQSRLIPWVFIPFFLPFLLLNPWKNK